jgi:phytoene dehydrogenase-like protein
VSRGQWRFDTGPSLLLMPQAYRDAFEALGTTLEEHVTLRRVDPAYRVFFGDDTHVDLSYDVQHVMQQLETFEQGAGADPQHHV